MGNKQLKIKKREKANIKNCLHLFYKTHYYYGKRDNYHKESQKQLCQQDITTYPEKKPNLTPMMFMGVRKYRTLKERKEVREFLIEKEVKLNWHIVELVHKPYKKKGNIRHYPNVHYNMLNKSTG